MSNSISDTVYANENHVSGGVPIASRRIGSDKATFYENDYLGNTTAVRSDGELRPAFSTPFGDSAGQEVADRRFTGKPYDADLNAYVFPYRNYSVATSRWMSADPIGFPDGPNRHFYAPVPTMGLDPWGLTSIINGAEDLSARTINSPYSLTWEVGSNSIPTSTGLVVYELNYTYTADASTSYTDSDGNVHSYSGEVSHSGTIYNKGSGDYLYVAYQPSPIGGIPGAIPTLTSLILDALGLNPGDLLLGAIIGDIPLNPTEEFWNAMERIAGQVPKNSEGWSWSDVNFEL